MKKSVLILIICMILLLHWFTSNNDDMIPKDFSHKTQIKQKEKSLHQKNAILDRK